MKKIRFEDLIIHETQDYIIINKPPYLSTLEDRSSDENVLSMAKKYCATAQVCHRLDKETSGVLVIAKNPEAYQAMSIQFEKRKVKKNYHAVADGLHAFNELVLDFPIVILGNGQARVDFQKGKLATTIITTLAAFKMHTLLDCSPVTGRFHQIRAHLAHQQAPIAGDTQYGGEPFFLSKIKKNYHLKKFTEERPLMQRVSLHAHSIEFSLLNGEKLKVIAPYPKDFDVLLKQLEKYR